MERFWTTTKPSKLFKELKPFDFVLVVGPQRAGGTITTAMIANDLDYEYLEEQEIWERLRWQPPPAPAPRDFLAYIKPENAGCVIHCPEHTAHCHVYAGLCNVAVVMVRRNKKDIIDSQIRIGWGFEQHELAHYPGCKPPICEVKYDFWDGQQKKRLGKQAFDVEYQELKTHPMWLGKSQRYRFTVAQIEIGNPRGQVVQHREPVK